MLSECNGEREARDVRAFTREGFLSWCQESICPGKRKDKSIISSEQVVEYKVMNWSPRKNGCTK